MKKIQIIDLHDDKQYLYDNLNESELEIIENILQAELDGKIGLPENRFDENGNVDFELLEIVVYDESYIQNGYELLVLKWIHDYEDIGYLVECIHEEKNKIEKIKDLKAFDIIVCDYSPMGRSSDVRYVVVFNDDGEKVAVSFKSNCNDGIKPEGWYRLYDFDSSDDRVMWNIGDLDIYVTAVYRPLHFTHTFNGELNNEEYYQQIWKRK